LSAWGARAERAHRNLLENLPIFSTVVLVVHVTGHANSASALGAMIFVVGRALHAIVYLMGVRYLRTAVFFVAQVTQAPVSKSASSRRRSIDGVPLQRCGPEVGGFDPDRTDEDFLRQSGTMRPDVLAAPGDG
jgi:hypothetical protein